MKIDRKDLLARCDTVKPAIRTSSSMPALSFLWFRGGYVYGYDGGMGLVCALPAGIEFEGGVQGSTLVDLLSSSTKETVEFAPGKEGLDLKIGSSRAKLTYTPIERFFWSFPVKPPEGEPLLKITSEVLAAIKAVLPVKHEAPRIPEHHGVVVASDGEVTWFFTTDTFAIAAYRVEGPALPGKAILPRAFAQQVLKHGKEDQPIWSHNGALSLFAGQTPGQIQVHSNSLDTEEIKDLERVVAVHTKIAEEGAKIPAGLAEALNRAEILARKDKPNVEIQADDNSMAIRGKYEGGNLHESLDLAEGENLPERTIKVDSGQLKRGLPLATHIAIGEESIVLYGADGKYTYVLAAAD